MTRLLSSFLFLVFIAWAPAAVGQPEEAAPSIASVQEVGAVSALVAKVKQGKRTGYVLLGLSVFGMAVALERLVGLRGSRIVPPTLAREADALYEEGNYDAIRTLCGRHPSVLADVIDALVEHRDFAPDDARQLADDVGSTDIKLHHQRNYPLLIVGTIAPLLGLLGTVFGMIRSFEDVAALGSLGDPRVLADGISQALVTTAMGLVIAVPALIAYHFFKSRLMRHTITMEKQITELLRRWFVAVRKEG